MGGRDAALARCLQQVPAHMPVVLDTLQQRLKSRATLLGVEHLTTGALNPSLFCPREALIDALTALVSSIVSEPVRATTEVRLTLEVGRSDSLVTQFVFAPVSPASGARISIDRLEATIGSMLEQLRAFDVEIESMPALQPDAPAGFVFRVHHC